MAPPAEIVIAGWWEITPPLFETTQHTVTVFKDISQLRSVDEERLLGSLEST